MKKAMPLLPLVTRLPPRIAHRDENRATTESGTEVGQAHFNGEFASWRKIAGYCCCHPKPYVASLVDISLTLDSGQ